MKRVRSIVCIVLVLVFIAGLGIMLFGDFRLGVTMWAVSSIAGGYIVYETRRREKLKQEEQGEGA